MVPKAFIKIYFRKLIVQKKVKQKMDSKVYLSPINQDHINHGRMYKLGENVASKKNEIKLMSEINVGANLMFAL